METATKKTRKKRTTITKYVQEIIYIGDASFGIQLPVEIDESDEAFSNQAIYIAVTKVGNMAFRIKEELKRFPGWTKK